MDIYFDESGNTGSVKVKNNKLNYDNQRHFALCGVICKSDDEKNKIQKKYCEFKKKYNIQGELKGNSLMTKKNNKLLHYFIEEILDASHFQINIYDKKFYLITKMLQIFLGYEFKREFPVESYKLASSLINENEDILIKYLQLEENITLENVELFTKYLMDFPYNFESNFLLSTIAQKIIENTFEDQILNDLIEESKYDGTISTNIVNLNALSEFILMFKKESGISISNKSINIYHDKIDGFFKVFQNELDPYGILVHFTDSADNIFIQVADNVASIFCKVFNQMINIFENKKEWCKESEWTLDIASKLINQIHVDNIKFTLPIQDWDVALCVSEMFKSSYRRENRNNIHFNPIYISNMDKIYESIDSNMREDLDSLNFILKR
ncbi:DUF3800 domain-containing protein [Sporolactobacillus laevolacticus]|uniref:DUF3800 domain-containing protein n=1 Tax=Sporolactobacillus laevolacticus DSM 442 TaxID=1395513 RepID=V6J1K2_9BACL|nr:DUF3800 domain-containing protein [Sporolactobacillus laevolacticus]EST13707.1 hypothetical protein P343_01760 [Sporolactobacillus laevolacticus DSM 442]